VDVAVVFAGEAVDLIHRIDPAAEIVSSMVRDAETVLARDWTT
jgi:hypothetical protein